MLQTLIDFNQFLKLISDADTFFVYKYNPNYCSLSDKTKPKVENFLTENSPITGYVIDVIKQPELKIQIAEHVDIPHESPQIICFKSGKYLAHTSHMKIKEERIIEAFSL